MLLSTMIYLALLGQVDYRAHFEPNDQTKREIQEAAHYAEVWAFHKITNLGAGHPAMYVMRQAGYRQICKAYDISPKQFNSIIADKEIARLRFVPTQKPEGKDPRGIRFGTHPWSNSRTLFDPSEVALSPKLARLVGHANPKTEAKAKSGSAQIDRETSASTRSQPRRQSGSTSPSPRF